MSRYDEVVRIGKKLDKLIASKEVDSSAGYDLLKTLRKQEMTLEILEKTKIGKLVNDYRRLSTKDETISLAKTLIKNWKKLLPDSRGSSSSSVHKSSSSASLNSQSRADDGDSRDSQNVDMAAGSSSETSTPPHANAGTGDDGNDSGDGGNAVSVMVTGRASKTSDPTRNKCRDMLSKALKDGPELDGAFDPVMLAASIEDHIYNEINNTDMKYINRVRSRIANLKDAKNPRLRENVMLGLISASRIASMTSEEMASDDLKSLRAQMTKQAIDEHQMATQGGTKSDLFKCGRCGHRDTTYNQVQTRSADEPMTTFVLCNNCGLRWKSVLAFNQQAPRKERAD